MEWLKNWFGIETTKKNNEKVEYNMKTVTTLKNGVVVLENTLQADFVEAQEILDHNCYTQNIDAECAWNERPENDFEHTYKMVVERDGDYKRFLGKLENERTCVYDIKYKRERVIMSAYYNDEISDTVAREKLRELRNEEITCDCKKCQFEKPTFEEWKSGKYGERGMKLGKTMRKAGFSQELLDFYSTQIKEEKEIFLTVSSLPQFIAGMSYYCKMDSWDGFQGSSCQDPRHEDEDYPIKLGGALHDNKLFIAMLHDKYEDLEDMTDKLKARTLMRYVVIDGKPALIANSYYGNNTTKDLLQNALEQLHEAGIFDRGIKAVESDDEIIYHKERANGSYTFITCDEVHVCETIEHEESISCPMCSGSGEHEVYSDRIDRWIDVTCPMCKGDGEYTTYIYEEIDEYVEVEDEREVLPYVEGYEHNGGYIEIRINKSKLDKIRNSFQVVAE